MALGVEHILVQAKEVRVGTAGNESATFAGLHDEAAHNKR